ncbi:MAG: hypothetical protein ACLP7P_08525 [Rhodomicrobium sp.]
MEKRADWDIDSRGRYTAKTFGKVQRRHPTERERSMFGGNWIPQDQWPVRYFKTKEAALKAAEKHIRMVTKIACVTEAR